MPDSVVLQSVTVAGDTLAADEIGGLKFQRAKVSLGADGSAADWRLGQQTMANSAPVVLASDQSSIPVVDAAAEASLASIATQAALIAGYTDGLEALVAATNTLLSTIDGRVDGLEAQVALIQGYVDGIEALLTTLIGHVDGVEGQLTTITGHVDGLEALIAAGNALLTTIDADTSVVAAWNEAGRAAANIISGQAGVQGGSGAVSANTQRVVLATDVALPTGANTIGSIASVTTSVTPGTAAANLGKAEDQSHNSGDVGVMALGVANEANTARAADGDYLPPALDTEGNVRIVGNRDHDAADAGEVVKVGSRVQDYEPDTDATESGGLAEVAEGDRANLSLNRRGELIEGVNSQRISLSTLNVTYDDSPTTVTSSAFECWNYRWAGISYTIDSTNTPTDLRIDVEVSHDGTNYAKLMNGPLGMLIYDDVATATAISRSLVFPIAAYKIRVTITCTGTTGANTFAVSNFMLFLRN